MDFLPRWEHIPGQRVPKTYPSPSPINQLAQETSPYLRQHAHNPVHWQAWSEATLARARAENKPILVSIGYSTCHWCHVMERESFEDETTAALMNERFVCIKVDREERPDVDAIYMEACQAINGSGGWPLNAFLLPDGRPFYAGTYYPPEAKYNRPSWRDVLLSLSNSYRDNYEQIVEQAERLTKSIAGGGERLLKIEPVGEDHAAWRNSLLEKLRASYDHDNGGFGGAPKFPMSQALEALVANAALTGQDDDRELAHHALLSMLDGGIYDQLGGGFSRYAVDAAWRVPHFEKMLYDNALLLRLLAKLQLSKAHPRYLQAIEETTAWLQREMLLPPGGYRAALDADSEGVEGKYFVWSLREVEALLPPDQARIAREFYGLTQLGNWEEEQTNIPFRPHDLVTVAERLDLPLDVAQAQLTAARKTLHDYRFTTRIHPGEDDKVILQWNALLVSAFTWCFRATKDQSYLTRATNLYTALRNQLFVGGGWHRNVTEGQLGAPAFLDDLAATAEALLDLYEVTFDWQYVDAKKGEAAGAGLGGARQIADYLLEHFSTEEGPMFHLRPQEDSELPVATVDLFDNALPSGNGQVASVLLRLGRLLDDDRYLQRGEAMLAAMAGSLQRYPTSFGGWVRTALTHAAPERELVVAGPDAAAHARRLLSRYRPGVLIVATESDRKDVSLFQNRYLPDGLRYYVCQNKACQLPVATAAEAVSQLDLAPAS